MARAHSSPLHHRRRAVIACTVKVAGHIYTGLFCSTCAATLDAMTRFPNARGISVRAMP